MKVKRIADGVVFNNVIIHNETEEAIVVENGCPVLISMEDYEIVPEVVCITTVAAMILMLQGNVVKTSCGRAYKYSTTDKMFVDTLNAANKLEKFAGKMQTLVWLAPTTV